MRRLPAAVVVAAVVLLVLVAAHPVGGPVSGPPREAAEGDDTGIGLLRDAAYAGRARSYAGTRLITTWGASGPSSALTHVRNVPGEGLTVRAETGTLAAEVDPGSPAAGLVSPFDGMLDVLARNYRVETVGTGTACGRTGRVVQATRADGSPAARYLVDEASGVLLRREVFDGRGTLTRADAFIELSVPQERPAPWMSGRAWYGGSLTDGGPSPGQVGYLRQRGWDVPPALPGRLELFTAGETAEGYLHLGYSDGLSVVSIFVQRGTLDESRLAGWRARSRGGHTIWIRGLAGFEAAAQQVVWASGEHVYTVVADAPADLVDAAVGALPHEEGIGAWEQVCRGADRLLSWISPFA
ncbi:hypothetical protein DP939_18535 [Spongiactinospora rosea]|uniref:MucB/RseB N-terminal domain-containing protein n=1 Tax=Spongiactinospora rosea TaxID=2248750 RepID=A0A366LZA0_9ACTN|nr:hypothetical protein [Spongiactinospora rosea]RBQ18502.1 hypothetical protein DP939_18535 [Spongiactinospora rosea]